MLRWQRNHLNTGMGSPLLLCLLSCDRHVLHLVVLIQFLERDVIHRFLGNADAVIRNTVNVVK